jgi:hypothetical protein
VAAPSRLTLWQRTSPGAPATGSPSVTTRGHADGRFARADRGIAALVCCPAWRLVVAAAGGEKQGSDQHWRQLRHWPSTSPHLRAGVSPRARWVPARRCFGLGNEHHATTYERHVRRCYSRTIETRYSCGRRRLRSVASLKSLQAPTSRSRSSPNRSPSIARAVTSGGKRSMKYSANASTDSHSIRLTWRSNSNLLASAPNSSPTWSSRPHRAGGDA